MLEQYAMPGVSTNIEPELARRLLRLLDHFGGRVMIESGYRSKAQQQALYAAWLASGKTNPPSVAVPGTSKHERDPAEATDLHRTDPSLTWGEVHYTAHAFGLWFPIAREDWHTELDPSWVEEEDDMAMSDDDMRKLAGFIAEALDARPRKTHSYRDGGDYVTNARTMEEWRQEEIQQATLAAQGQAPKG